jgi:hypothetical protein
VAGVVVLAGVLAALTVNPSAARAATAATWDRLAQCETGGDWAADYGNDLYGGLQLSAHTWKYYGGIQYTPQPDEATRPEQILVAQRLLEDASWKPWPVCSRKLHLTNVDAMGTPDVTDYPNTGYVKQATPAPSNGPTPTPDASTSPTPSATPTAPSATATPAPNLTRTPTPSPSPPSRVTSG